MTEVNFQEWREQNANLLYPFSDTAILTNGDVAVPSDLFLDLTLYPIGAVGQVYMSSIEIGSAVTIEFSDDDGVLCSGEYPLTGASTISFSMATDRSHAKYAGMAVLGTSVNSVSSWPAGNHSFTREQCPILPDVVCPMPMEGLQGFVLESGAVFSGYVVFYGENGVSFRYLNGAIKVDLIGDPRHRKSNGGSSLIGLKTINGRSPDSAGNFALAVGRRYVEDPMLRINPNNDNDGLELSFVCSGG